MSPILRCALCHHTGLDVESRIVADESLLGYHREPRCVDVEACTGWRCDWVPDDLNPGPDCPYCAGQMCARFDGLHCTHDRVERHGYRADEVPA